MPSITQSTIRVLNRNGVEAVLPPDAGCCGSLEHHLGREEGAFAKARANVDAWTREIEGQGLDAILVTISGCGTTVKDYGFMLRNDPAYAAKAAKVSSLAKRRVAVSGQARREALGAKHPASRSPITRPARSSTARRCIGNRRTCSRLVGSASRRCRRRICAAARPAPTTSCSRRSPDGCATARSPTSRRPAPDVIAAGNIGCITQIASGTAIPVVHPVELVDWATGGPVPERIEGACRRIAHIATRGRATWPRSEAESEEEGGESQGEDQEARRAGAPQEGQGQARGPKKPARKAKAKAKAPKRRAAKTAAAAARGRHRCAASDGAPVLR